MNWRKLTSWTSIFSYRQKIWLLVLGGVIVGLGLLFLYLLRMHTYIAGDDPAACVNCHIMSPYYATWSHSSHGRDATCNDCHVPNGNIVSHYAFKGMDGMKHVAYFVTRSERQAIIIRNKYNVNVKEYYLEHLSREDVAKLYQSMDLMLMTSISEGSPQVVKEAMATDLPVVSTNVGDVSVLLEGVQNSYVANSRAPQELADLCIKSLFEKQDYILSPSMKIKKMGLDNTSVAKRILSKYHELLGK